MAALRMIHFSGVTKKLGRESTSSEMGGKGLDYQDFKLF